MKSHRLPPLTPSGDEIPDPRLGGMGFQAYVQILTLTLRNLLTSLGLPFVSCKRPASLGVFGGGSEIHGSERALATRVVGHQSPYQVATHWIRW